MIELLVVVAVLASLFLNMFLQCPRTHQDMIHQAEQQQIEREERLAATGAMCAPDASELRAVEASGEQLAEGVSVVSRSSGGATTAPAFVRMRDSHPEVEADLTYYDQGI